MTDRLVSIPAHLFKQSKVRLGFLVTFVWALGAAWILIPHPFEGRVVLVISNRYGWGAHTADPVGIVGPAIVSFFLLRPHLVRFSGD